MRPCHQKRRSNVRAKETNLKITQAISIALATIACGGPPAQAPPCTEGWGGHTCAYVDAGESCQQALEERNVAIQTQVTVCGDLGTNDPTGACQKLIDAAREAQLRSARVCGGT